MEDDQIMQQETQEERTDGFLEGWEESDSGYEDAPLEDSGGERDTPPAEERGEEPGGEQAEGPETTAGDNSGGESDGQTDGGEQPAPAPKTWTLNHMGQAVTISEGDIPILAQKGLDYDRLLASYNEVSPVMDLFRDFARQAGIPVQEYVGRLRAQAKQAQGMDEAEARRAVEMEDREARVNAQEAAAQARQEAARRAQAAQAMRQQRINADIQEFISVYPNAALDFQSIPQEVWEAVDGGMSLVAAYTKYNNAQSSAAAQNAEEERQRQEVAAQRNARNAAASTGSMKSAGQNHGPKDPFLEGWDED